MNRCCTHSVSHPLGTSLAFGTLALASILTLLAPSDASAGEWTVGAGANASVPLSGEAGQVASTGFGVDALLGYEWDVPLVDVGIGLNPGYTRFGDARVDGQSIDGGKVLAYADVTADTEHVQPFGRLGLGWAMLEQVEEDVVEVVQGMSWALTAGLRIPLVEGLDVEVRGVIRQVLDARSEEPSWTWLDAGAGLQYRF